MSECDIAIKSFINKKWFSTWCFSNSSKSVPRQRTLPVLFSTKPMHTSSGGAFTVCSELYHYLQLSQKCPKFLFGFPGNPVFMRFSEITLLIPSSNFFSYHLINSYIFSVKCPKICPDFQKLGHRDIFLFSMAEFSFLLPSSCG
jgi:hypothetical protein